MRKAVRTSMARAALLGGLVVFAASSVQAAEKVLDRTFTVTPGGLLTVNADGASIDVTGSDSNRVVVHMVVQGSEKELGELKLSASQSDGGVTVEMLRPDRRGWRDWGTRNIEARIEVTVPRSYRVDAKTSGGDVRLESFTGSSRLRTSGGGIVAKHLKGDLDGETSGGDVRLEAVEGAIRVHTSGGGIHADKVQGDIDARTSGGDVRLLRIDGKIRAHTSGGNVQCELVGANRGISAGTSGGDIRLTMPGNITGALDAETSGGDIDSEFPVATTRVAEHRLTGLINGGGETIRLHTSGGGITLSKAN
jgi:DUF4097 and DUF4098 domain-containing protein YvlB